MKKPYRETPWDYVANHISWRVDGGNIYIHWGYDPWCDDYCYARQTRGAADSTAATPAKPVRQFGKKAE